jgi:acetyltransferase-like isoleucine patch superfamily enzyme
MNQAARRFSLVQEHLRRGGIALLIGLFLNWLWERLFALPLQAIRASWLRLLCMQLGQGSRIDWTARVTGPGRIAIGNSCTVGRNCHLKSASDQRGFGEPNLVLGNNVFLNDGTIVDANYLVVIGDNTMLGPHCMVIDSNHRFNDPDRAVTDQGCEYKPVTIGRDCWIGAHSLVLAGVTVGDHSIIGANSTVTHDIPPCSLAVGTPARTVRGI